MQHFWRHLTRCDSCPRACGVDRMNGEIGYCGLDARIPVSHIGRHFGEEPPISGTSGSGTIFFTGCNLRCVFCQNFQISQDFSSDISYMSADQLATAMIDLQKTGAHNINFVTPSHVQNQMAEAIIIAKKEGLTIPVVYNSNGYDTVSGLGNLKGLIDIYLPDIKYMDNTIGNAYSDTPDYADRIEAVLIEMLTQVGQLKLDKNDIAKSGILVRHLVLPSHLDNSRRVLDLLASISGELHISLMSQYSPQFKASQYPLINRKLLRSEYEEIVDYAWDLDLKNVFVQEMESAENYLPDFEEERPFK